MNRAEWKQRIENSRCTVIGFGVSNRPLVRYLRSLGATVSVRDKAPREKLGEDAELLEREGVRFITGEGYLDGIDEDIIFRTPGLRPDAPPLKKAVANGAILTSETELFLALTSAVVLGVTGSDGKTTTTTLTGLMLEAECKRTGRGRVFVGGNIGEPLLPRVDEMTADDYAVVELSSFQLCTFTQSPHRSALTNLSPNHLDWHTDMEEYVLSKKNIFSHRAEALVTANAENGESIHLIDGSQQSVTWFSSVKSAPKDFGSLMRTGDRAVYLKDGRICLWDGEREDEVLTAGEILLPGKHNLENYMTAIALTQGLVSKESIREVAQSFGGVAHRLEKVRVHKGVTYYNSSIDSTPTRTAAALGALDPVRPIVICGGYDKHVPFEPLADALLEHAGAVVLTGATAQKILGVIEMAKKATGKALPVYLEADFRDAVLRAKNVASEGDVVLLSPACASFDAFRNFSERGETFRQIVKAFE